MHQFVMEFGELLRVVYEHTIENDQSLRKPLAKYVVRHFDQLREEQEQAIKQALMTHGEFAYDVLVCSREQWELEDDSGLC